MPPYQGVLLDIDGVLTVSWRPLPGAVDAIAKLRAAGYKLRFVTNTTSRTRPVLSETLIRAGFDIAADEILTAAAATAAYLRRVHPDARCFLLTSGEVGTEFDGITITSSGEPADVVVIGGAGVEFSHDSLNHAFRLLQDGVPLVAMHRNLFWKTGDKLTLDAGAYVVGLEQASGTHATVVGKPARAFYERALAELGVPAASTIVVGDDIEADVRGAREAGMTGILVRTGKFRQADLDRSGVTPDAVIDSIAALPAWLQAQSAKNMHRV
jgi:HAD superfamily hydrolase (TIGR01458 family)